MDGIFPWLGDLNETQLGRGWVGLICILASTLCGVLVGLERERRDKPAGLRTLVLIAVGSTIFTLVGLLLSAKKDMADPARLAAHIIPGIGFLGAGAIIQSRGTVVGLTTGATIWAVAAVGVAIGSGYVAAGVGFTIVILLTLTLFYRFEWVVVGRCRFRRATVAYAPDNGKARPTIQAILDAYEIPDSQVGAVRQGEDGKSLDIQICLSHREHRSILKELADIPQVRSLEVEEG